MHNLLASYTYFDNLNDLLPDVPPDTIISRTIYKDAQIKAVMFAFDAGQSLSDHTAAQAAIIHILSGEAELGVGGDIHTAGAGAWVHMPPNTRHHVIAKTPVRMLLLLQTCGVS